MRYKKFAVVIFLVTIGFIGYYFFTHYVFSPTFSKLPVSYEECVKVTSQTLVTNLTCQIVVGNSRSNLYQQCIEKGGGTGIDSRVCNLTYFNFAFNDWPKNYQECIVLIGGGDSDVCDITIPGGNVYKDSYDKVLELRDRCIQAGEKTITKSAYGEELNPTLCSISFKEPKK